MSNDRRLLTFLIASSNTSKVRRFSIHRSFLYTGSSLCLLAVLFATGSAIRFVREEVLNVEYQSIKAENEDLKRENHEYQNQYSRMKTRVDYIEDMSVAIARQTRMGIEGVVDVDRQVGTGGPESIENLDKSANNVERQVRQISDRLQADMLRLASIPSGLPVHGYVTDGFGVRHNPFGGEGREFHSGVDIAVDFGTPVESTADGLVVWAAAYAGYGNLVVVYHSNGITTRYGHLSKIRVEQGQRIKRGDQIGDAGSTGRSTGPHVHYEIRQNDQPINALQYIGQR